MLIQIITNYIIFIGLIIENIFGGQGMLSSIKILIHTFQKIFKLPLNLTTEQQGLEKWPTSLPFLLVTACCEFPKVSQK